ncbi:MAG: right-handed parallel beta-helix repeat-containing protein, partial [Mycobacteriales bacterium]
MSASTGRKSVVVGVVAVATALLSVAWSATADAAPASCTADAGGTGLSAAVVATASQKISATTVDATGCDIGIYVGSGATGVTIDGVTVTGAGFQGILAEKTSALTVQNSTVDGNGFKTIDPSAPPLEGSGLRSKVGQSFGISLFGVSDSTITGNKVYDNGRGGIGVMDNGPNDPGALTQNTKAPLVASTNDSITNNQVWRNYGGCAIVVATQNFGGSLSQLTITGNTIVGTGMSQNGPDIGGIVVAADLPTSSVSTVSVSGNTIDGSFEGGVIVNAIAPGSSTQNVTVTGNVLRANNFGAQEAPQTAGIIVYAPGGHNTGTVVSNNTNSDQYYGVWTYKSPGTSLSGNVAGPGTTIPVSQVSTPTRVLDTRSGVGAAKAPVAAGKTVTLTLSGVPAGATAAVLNLTATGLSGAPSSFVAACPAATSVTACAKTSVLNVAGSGAVANEVTVPIGSDGKVTLYNNAGSLDLVA